MKRIERLVVGTDFSPIAGFALDRALDLARQLGATITLVHAFEIPVLSLPDGAVTATLDMTQKITSAAQAQLAETVKSKRETGVAMDTLLRMGVPWEEINAVAEERNADMIVIGTHGRRGLSRALLGSVAERLIRTAEKPVLVVHGKDPDGHHAPVS